MARVIEIKNLKTQFKTENGLVKAVDGVSYYIEDCEIVGLVGESGCGKSVTQLSVMQLIPVPPGKITEGEVFFEGKDILKLERNSDQMRAIRGGKIAMVFQEPMTSLNPVLTIRRQMTEMLELHLQMDRQAARKKALDLLKLVGIPDAVGRFNHYPHQFSGGMRQRVMIAMALSCNPKLIIADEPTTSVDVTTQAQILEIMKNMVTRFGTSLMVVTHNLGVVARYASRIYVMYAGRIIESGTSKEIFSDRRHPYTIGLLKSVPRLDEPRRSKLVPIEGLPPDLIDAPPTCAFLPRCEYSFDMCRKEPWPELRHVIGQHYVSCYADVREEKG